MAVKKKIKTPDRDEMAQIIADSLNSLISDEDQVAFFLDGYDETPIDLNDWVSTGATMLDLAISNRPHGGLPVGRIVEITGLEQSGKSLLAAHVIANTQKRGGIGVIIDTEASVHDDFYRAIGLDMTKLVYVHAETIEDVFDMITNIIEKVRKTEKDKIVTIVVDSVSAASTKSEIESKFTKDGYATDKAIILSKAMRKITNMLAKQRILLIFTNQLRQKMNAMPFADQYTTSGGMSLRFHSSVRLRLKMVSKIKNSSNDVIGVSVKAIVVKNRCGPPLREAIFDIYFDRGIDDYSAWLKVMKEKKLIKQAGAWYKFIDEDGEEHKFQSKDFAEFLEADPDRKSKIYDDICENIIMAYRSTDKKPIFEDAEE